MYRLIPAGRMADPFFDSVSHRDSRPEQDRQPAFRADIRVQGDSYLLEADLPGLRKEDIDLHLQDGVLTITAVREKPAAEDTYLCRERPMGRFVRAFDVSGIQEDAIRAAYENGVLTLVLPKKGKPEPESFRISIQ